jgi:putative membrane protein
MNGLVFVKMLHLISLLVLLYASAFKNILLNRAQIEAPALAKALRLDKLSGAAAGVMMLSGVAMLLWLAKPTSYYLQNPYFLLKIFIFVLASSLVVVSKIFLRRAFKASHSTLIVVPKHIQWILRFDLLGLLIMAGLGGLVTRGLV